MISKFIHFIHLVYPGDKYIYMGIQSSCTNSDINQLPEFLKNSLNKLEHEYSINTESEFFRLPFQ